ncbi:MAG: SDR family NAD(P)-dependent oxidoreductase [Candidatus Acidiferrales bacterium]
MPFDDKVALVAGGTGALGREVAMALLEAGARVAVTYRRADEFQAFVAAAERTGAPAPEGASVDVTDVTAVETYVAELAARHGRLDILVNAVGGYGGGKNVWEAGADDYDRMMALNFKAGFALVHAIVPVMIRQNRGWIVNVASKAAYGHSAGAALYAASKAAALVLMESLAEEVKAYNINVNSIVPSIFDTAANRQAMPKADYSKWPKPEQIARVVLFLCSEDARLIHGAAIPVYGRS